MRTCTGIFFNHESPRRGNVRRNGGACNSCCFSAPPASTPSSPPSHVIPAMLRRFYEAVQEGREHTQPVLSQINVGTGVDCSIRELAETIAAVTGFRGRLRFDTSKPGGTPRELLDVSRLRALGWEAGFGLREGLEGTYEWFVAQEGVVRG